MTHRRAHPRAAWIAAVALPVLTPGALALATDQGDPAPTTPATTTPTIVTEHTATARHVVPFAIQSGDEGRRTIFAFGRTRPASTLSGTTPVAPTETTPTDAVLLQGTIANAAAATAWRRTTVPLDTTNVPLPAGSWRPADDTTDPAEGPAPDAAAVMHSGEGTPKGAAALLVRIVRGGGEPPRTAILARTADGRFREVPSPPAELTAPATDAFAGPDGQLVPFAVTDAPIAGDQPERGRTAVLLAPVGGDGVLRWDGTRWSEESWVDADGTPTGPRTPLELAATPAGDAVALFAGDATAPTGTRVRLARRNPATKQFAPVMITGTSPLLQGALPSGAAAIRPVSRPGTALTISPKHWWVDLLVTRDDDTRVSATVHLRPPGVREPGTTPDPTTPGTTPTSPQATTATTPDPSTPTTPDPPTTPTTPGTTPAATTPTDAEVTGSWCTPSLSSATACDRELGFRFATVRGWTSAAFDGSGRYGERALSSPVIPEDDSATTPREASASGGYLQLTGTTFSLRSGVGDDGTNDTQAARFAAGGFAVTGGVKGIGRTMPRTTSAFDAIKQLSPGMLEGALDIAVSPPGTPDEQRGAYTLGAGGSVMRQQGGHDWRPVDYNWSAPEPASESGATTRRGTPRAMVWAKPDLVLLAGVAGILIESGPPESFRPYTSSGPTPPPWRPINVGDDDLLDVAAAGDDAMAVGRDGAAWRRIGGEWTRLKLPDALSKATLLSVAYAGKDPIVASTKGVLTIDPATGSLDVDPDLATFMRQDGRPVSAEIVAGLPDGAAVVDGRYVRPRAGAPWARLDSPIEGDVVALNLWRAPGGATPTSPPTDPTDPTDTATDSTPAPTSILTEDGLGDLRIAASVADARRGTMGETREERYRDKDKNETVNVYEDAPRLGEGRLAVLGPGGWVDRSHTPLAGSNSRDLAARTPPITAIGTDADGNGWVAGGSGTINDLFQQRLTEVPELFLAPLGNAPFDTRSADDRPVDEPAARRLADTTPTTPEPATTPLPTDATTPTAPDVPLPAPSGPATVRVLVGGHPACLSECAGRGDQGLAPDANLDDALTTAERVSAPGQGTVPSILVLGGGRATPRGRGLSKAAAAGYLDLVRAHPTVPAVLAIGTGDASTAASRANFAGAARSLLRERTGAGSAVTLATTPTAPIERPGSTTVAYALDVTNADGGRARVVVIDNAGGRLNGSGQDAWLADVLGEAERSGWMTVVVGAARLDGAGAPPTQATDREDELTILGRNGADAYIATDGVDDQKSPYFGDQSVRYPADRGHGGTIEMYRTAALGHDRPAGLFAEFTEQSSDDVPDARIGWQGPALFDVSLGGPLPNPDVSLLPVLSSVPAQEMDVEAGSAQSMVLLGVSRATTGMRIPKSMVGGDDRQPAIQKDDVIDVPVITTPGTTPDDTDPTTPTTPGSAADEELVDTRAPGWVYASPLPCRLYGDDEECSGQAPIDATYDVADPSIAVFVRARPRKNGQPPTIVTDEHGDPVIDRTSSVLCPLRPGKTTMLLRVSGRTASYPLTVYPQGGRRPSNAAATTACAFNWGRPPTTEEQPKPTTPEAPAPPVIAEPGPQPQLPPSVKPTLPILVPRPIPPLASSIPFTPLGLSASAAPPVAPNPKPAAPGAPPAPPSGVSVQQAPVHQTSVQVQSAAVQQTVGVKAEERRTEVAREGADYRASRLSHESAAAQARRQAAPARGETDHAVRRGSVSGPDLDASPTYRPADTGPAVPLIAGGLLAMLTALAGHAAGRRRRAAARRRSWLR